MGRVTQPARTIIPGHAVGEVLKFAAPISFWGGVDPATGTVCDPRHPQSGESLAGRVLILPETVGSSSSSAIMLELMRNGLAPAGVVIGTVDAILVLGIVVGRELGYDPVPVVETGVVSDIPSSGAIRIDHEGIGWDVP